ncbi:hypothetical protein HK102_012994 [Quaeritorhiza haematococci]|nr:hypothetical protein HK102_012994 [Quaeritorhiza haematococci]
MRMTFALRLLETFLFPSLVLVSLFPSPGILRPELKPRQDSDSSDTNGGGGSFTSPRCFTNPPSGQFIQANDTTIGQWLSNSSDNRVLYSLLDRLNLTTFLENPSVANVTMFAPNDEAFYALPSWIPRRFNYTQTNPLLRAFLYYHVHPSPNVCTSAFPRLGNDTTDGGRPNSVSTLLPVFNLTTYRNNTGDYFVNDAHVYQVVNTSNGIIYGIDR